VSAFSIPYKTLYQVSGHECGFFFLVCELGVDGMITWASVLCTPPNMLLAIVPEQ